MTGGSLGTRRIAIAWSDPRFETEGKQLVATLDILRDQLRASPDYNPDKTAIVMKLTEPIKPLTREPPHNVTNHLRHRGRSRRANAGGTLGTISIEDYLSVSASHAATARDLSLSAVGSIERIVGRTG